MIVRVAGERLGRLDGTMASEVIVGRTGGVTVILAVRVEFLYTAVTLTVVDELTVAARTSRLAVVWFGGIVRVAGAGKSARLLLVRLMIAPLDGAGPVRDAVKVEETPPANEVGLNARVFSVTGVAPKGTLIGAPEVETNCIAPFDRRPDALNSTNCVV